MGSNPSRLPNLMFSFQCVESPVPHRSGAAFLAIRVRSSSDNFSALALPPFRPPSLPSVTALASFPGGGSGFSICPVAINIVSSARTFISGLPFPRFVDLFGTSTSVLDRFACVKRGGFKLRNR
jgi:hypothetical protein